MERVSNEQHIKRRRRLSIGDEEYDPKEEEGRRRNRLSAVSQSPWKTCAQFLFMSSVVPLLFFFRSAQHDEDSRFFRSVELTVPRELPAPFDFLPGFLDNYAQQGRMSSSSSMATATNMEGDHEWLDSDIVELHHCRSLLTSEEMHWGNFTRWAGKFVNETMRQLLASSLERQPQKNDGGNGENYHDKKISMREEIVLELLELYATQQGFCKFHRYRPHFRHQKSDSVLLYTAKKELPPSDHARLAFVIAVKSTHSIDQVKRLVRAIHMPYHFILLHLENRDVDGNDDLKTAMDELSDGYNNVMVIRFGTLVPTPNDSGSIHYDGMTAIHLKLMRYLTIYLGLKYDYHITLDGAQFPLLSAEELAKRLLGSSNSVWLGSMTDHGKRDVSVTSGHHCTFFICLVLTKQLS